MAILTRRWQHRVPAVNDCRVKVSTDAVSPPRCVPYFLRRVNVILMTGVVSYDLPGSSAADDVLFRQSSSIVVPDGSSHFVGASGPVYPQDVREVGAAFMPQNPWILYVAWGPVDTPYLWLPNYRFFVHRGLLLCRERNFSFFQGCIRVCLNGQDLAPLITIIIPHRLGGPERFHPSLPTRLMISEFPLPLVEIASTHRREWDWGSVEFSPFTLRQTESLARLRESWNEARRSGDIVGRPKHVR